MEKISELQKYLVGFLILWLTSCSPYQNLSKEKMTYRLGNRKVKVIQFSNATHASDQVYRELFYFNMHDNENTSVDACKRFINNYGGTLVELRHQKKRNITFKLEDGIKYTVDPNRIFTEKGIESTLKKFEAYSELAKQSVLLFRDQILRIIDVKKTDPIVALHNNTEDNYSMLSYLPDSIYATDVSQAYIHEGMDPDDFYFVTDSLLFVQLKGLNLNVALQNNVQVTDDGSLSVYCGREGLRYVNVEAQHGHEDEQYNLILQLNKILFENNLNRP